MILSEHVAIYLLSLQFCSCDDRFKGSSSLHDSASQTVTLIHILVSSSTMAALKVEFRPAGVLPDQQRQIIQFCQTARTNNWSLLGSSTTATVYG